MGLFSAVKDKIIHRNDGLGDMDISGPDEMRSHVLGEPMNDFGNEPMQPQSKYAPPSLSRMDTTRTHNIGPGPNDTMPPTQLIGRTANDLMPADRFRNESPMYSPAPPQPFGSQLGEPMQMQPQTMQNPAQQNNERIIEKIEYLRQDIKSLKDDIELLTERIKNVQQRVEDKRY